MDLPNIPRLIFTDKWNSLWHFVFGKISLNIWLIIPIFLIYQFIIKYDYNSIVDTVEFGIGYWYGKVLERVRGGNQADSIQTPPFTQANENSAPKEE